MPKYTFLVLTNATEGKDAEFNQWYDKEHLADVLRIPGYKAAQRFKLSDQHGAEASNWKYLSLYEVEADSADVARANLTAAGESGAMPVSDTLDKSTVFALFFEPVGPRVTA
jgi:hypothetical protein